jgi:hypothetical protein
MEVDTMDKYATLKEGVTYKHSNGDRYECLEVQDGYSVLQRLSDSWTLEAHGTRISDNGLIHWDYSCRGHWQKTKTIDFSM